eukprot:g1054.t1
MSTGVPTATVYTASGVAATSMTTVSVTIPIGTAPGQSFTFEYAGKKYNATVPNGYYGGQAMNVQVPASIPVATVVPNAYAPPRGAATIMQPVVVQNAVLIRPGANAQQMSNMGNCRGCGQRFVR